MTLMYDSIFCYALTTLCTARHVCVELGLEPRTAVSIFGPIRSLYTALVHPVVRLSAVVDICVRRIPGLIAEKS